MFNMENLYNWCVINKRYDLIKEWDVKLNGIDMKEVSQKSKKKYWWKCKKGHIFKATIYERMVDNITCPCCGKNSTFPEFIISYLLGKYYPTSMNYRPIWLNGRELDVYLARTNVRWNNKEYSMLAIEYDGARYHKSTEKDMVKNVLCEKQGVHLIRIREKGAASIPASEECIILKSHTNKDIVLAVKKILVRLGIKNPDVNMEKDIKNIKKRYYQYLGR